MTQPNQYEDTEGEHLNLTHLKDVRAVLKWCYDHGLLKGEFPDADSGGKSYLLSEGERRIAQLIESEATRREQALLDELEKESQLDWYLRNEFDDECNAQESGEVSVARVVKDIIAQMRQSLNNKEVQL